MCSSLLLRCLSSCFVVIVAVVELTPRAASGAPTTAATADVSAPDVDDLIRIRLEVTDLDGNVIAQIKPDGEFKLNGYVLDLRSTGNDGIFAAFADITYEPSLALANGPIDHGDYTTGASGASAPGQFDEIGGVSSQIVPLGPSERLLFTVPLVAGSGTGVVHFESNPADLVSPSSPVHNSLLYNDLDHIVGGVPSDLIYYGSTTLAIAVPEPSTLALAGIGVAGLLACRRRRRARPLR